VDHPLARTASVSYPGNLQPGRWLERRTEMPIKRTTHRSKSGKKLYAVRDSKGRFKDIQTYKRAHGQDVRRRSKAEAAKRKKTKKA
jgi:hypothetical protein